MGTISHCVGVRPRVTGSGSLGLKLESLDEIKSQYLKDLTMSPRTNILPMALSNFSEQGISLRIRTTGQGDYFIIDKITLFMKPYAMEYPQ